MTKKANDAIFVVEKYAIARDATPFGKDAQAPRFFEEARPALIFIYIVYYDLTLRSLTRGRYLNVLILTF